MEIDGVQLKERKETTTVTDDNEVNLGKTVIKHVRSIKGNAEMWKQEDTRSSSQEDIYKSVGEREDKEILESDEEVTQTVTIYQRMVVNDDGEEEEQTVETEEEVAKFLDLWNRLWQPEISDEEVQELIDHCLRYNLPRYGVGWPPFEFLWILRNPHNFR